MLNKLALLSLGLAPLALVTAPALAQQADLSVFQTGPVFEDFGPHAPIENASELPADAEFAIAFDVAKPAEGDARNSGFESAARFINMHVANGVAPERIKLVVVVHGKAALDLISDEHRASRDMAPNGSAAMLREMLDHGVRFILCGQSGVAYGITQDQLIEGVEVELSAMTAHALLQQQGYTVNPF